MARASLKSAMERALTKHTTVILDSLNNIKVGGEGSGRGRVCKAAAGAQ